MATKRFVAKLCQHPASKPNLDYCRDCWRNRGVGADGGSAKYTAAVCGHPCSARGLKFCRTCYDAKRPLSSVVTTTTETQLEKRVVEIMRTGAASLADLAQKSETTQGHVLDAILALKDRGLNVHQFGEKWSLEKYAPIVERSFTYTSRPDNTFCFGVSSDQHLCSRYAREDVLSDLYDAFQTSGVDRVFNAGNWVDGEDDKNRWDISVHGLEPQIKYLCEKYPKRDGIETFAIWGEDHEGWWSRREAIDVGKFTEAQMRQAGRTDWTDLGFVEARVDLVNANTGAKSELVVMHPGGGSSYAYSYRPQKIVESLSGGEKPAVLIIGHYHKMSCNIIRNVWTIQAACGQDQTVFMRKKGLEAHVGGHIVTLRQDPETGAIFSCVSDQRIYYDRAYYNDRWSKTGPVVQAPRFMGGVVPVA